MQALPSFLCNDIINLIYEYDPTKRYRFDVVLHQLIQDQPRICKNENFFFTEEMYEDIVKKSCIYNKMFGRRKRLSFRPNDLVHMKCLIFLSNPFHDYKIIFNLIS